MNTIAHTSPLAKPETYGKMGLTLTYAATAQEEEFYDFSTIDGGVIAYNAGTKAIDNGAGIFIGDYFVGMSDSCHSISSLPFVRY